MTETELHTHAPTTSRKISAYSWTCRKIKFYLHPVNKNRISHLQELSAAPPLEFLLLLPPSHVLPLNSWCSQSPSSSRPSPAHPGSPVGSANTQGLGCEHLQLRDVVLVSVLSWGCLPWYFHTRKTLQDLTQQVNGRKEKKQKKQAQPVRTSFR